jgi:integrase
MPRRGENIYKRKDNRWEGRYIKDRTPKGKAIYGYVYAKTYHDVKEKLCKAASCNPKQNNVSSVDTDLFESIAKEWFANIKLQIKQSTENKYWNLLNTYILPVYGNQPLSLITYDFIESYCNTLLLSGGNNGTGLSPKTVTGILSVIRNILKYAVQKGKTIPCNGDAIQIKQTSKEMRVLSKVEQEKLCQYLYSEPDLCNIGILICLFTGLRVGEICALRWEDITFSEKTIYVHSTMQRVQDRSATEEKPKTKIVITSPKSTCSIRIIPIPSDLVSILTSCIPYAHGYVLTNSDTKFIEPRTMQNRFKKALRESNIDPINFHALRHTFATRCIEVGFDVKSLSEILGHASVNITMNRYVHPTLDLKRKNMEKLSALLAVT